jgi:hypothetical protein
MSADHNVRIVGFETTYTPREDGTIAAVDYVDFSAVGNAKYTVVHMRIVDAKRDTTGLWEVIGPHYEAWKKGEELPEHGTPLAAWNGIQTGLVKVLKGHDIKSVEDLAEITDSVLQKIGLPDLRKARDGARRWVEAQGTRDIATALGQKDAQINALQEQMAEMMAMLKGDKADKDDEPVRRRPGRPRRDDAEEAAA